MAEEEDKTQATRVVLPEVMVRLEEEVNLLRFPEMKTIGKPIRVTKHKLMKTQMIGTKKV